MAGLPHSEQLAKKVAEVRHSQGSEIIKEGTAGSFILRIPSALHGQEAKEGA